MTKIWNRKEKPLGGLRLPVTAPWRVERREVREMEKERERKGIVLLCVVLCEWEQVEVGG